MFANPYTLVWQMLFMTRRLRFSLILSFSPRPHSFPQSETEERNRERERRSGFSSFGLILLAVLERMGVREGWPWRGQGGNGLRFFLLLLLWSVDSPFSGNPACRTWAAPRKSGRAGPGTPWSTWARPGWWCTSRWPWWCPRGSPGWSSAPRWTPHS